MLKLAEACDVEILLGTRSATPLREIIGYEPGWARPSVEQQRAIHDLMSPASRGGSAPKSATSR